MALVTHRLPKEVYCAVTLMGSGQMDTHSFGFQPVKRDLWLQLTSSLGAFVANGQLKCCGWRAVPFSGRAAYLAHWLLSRVDAIIAAPQLWDTLGLYLFLGFEFKGVLSKTCSTFPQEGDLCMMARGPIAGPSLITPFKIFQNRGLRRTVGVPGIIV